MRLLCLVNDRLCDNVAQRLVFPLRCLRLLWCQFLRRLLALLEYLSHSFAARNRH